MVMTAQDREADTLPLLGNPVKLSRISRETIT